MACAARSMARSMRGCAPQRHMCRSSACTISARLGLGLPAGNAAAVVTMPATQ
jgi:hypothetical protein